jgi:putative transposase
MTIVGWIDLFTRERYCEAVTDSFKFCIQHKGLRLFEYIIMPSHVHLIARHLEGGLHAVIRDMKSYLAKEFLRLPDTPGESRKEWLKYMFAYYAKDIRQNIDHMVWQKTSHPVELSNQGTYDQKVDYLIMNPVVSGYVLDETTWQYSSACKWSPLRLTENGALAKQFHD